MKTIVLKDFQLTVEEFEKCRRAFEAVAGSVGSNTLHPRALRSVLQSLGQSPPEDQLEAYCQLFESQGENESAESSNKKLGRVGIGFDDFLQIVELEKLRWLTTDGAEYEILELWVSMGGNVDKSGTIAAEALQHCLDDNASSPEGVPIPLTMEQGHTLTFSDLCTVMNVLDRTPSRMGARGGGGGHSGTQAFVPDGIAREDKGRTVQPVKTLKQKMEDVIKQGKVSQIEHLGLSTNLRELAVTLAALYNTKKIGNDENKFQKQSLVASGASKVSNRPGEFYQRKMDALLLADRSHNSPIVAEILHHHQERHKNDRFGLFFSEAARHAREAALKRRPVLHAPKSGAVMSQSEKVVLREPGSGPAQRHIGDMVQALHRSRVGATRLEALRGPARFSSEKNQSYTPLYSRASVLAAVALPSSTPTSGLLPSLVAAKNHITKALAGVSGAPVPAARWHSVPAPSPVKGVAAPLSGALFLGRGLTPPLVVQPLPPPPHYESRRD